MFFLGGGSRCQPWVSLNAAQPQYLLLLQLVDAVPVREHLKNDTAAALTLGPVYLRGDDAAPSSTDSGGLTAAD